MATFIHAKNTVVLFGAVDLSTWIEASDWNRGMSTEKVTAYGPSVTTESYGPTLVDGKVTFKGTASIDALGPDVTINPLMEAGTKVSLTFRPAGTGSTKPQRIVDIYITAYNTSHPVGGYVKFTIECQMSGTVNYTPQV